MRCREEGEGRREEGGLLPLPGPLREAEPAHWLPGPPPPRSRRRHRKEAPIPREGGDGSRQFRHGEMAGMLPSLPLSPASYTSLPVSVFSLPAMEEGQRTLEKGEREML